MSYLAHRYYAYTCVAWDLDLEDQRSVFVKRYIVYNDIFMTI